MYMFHDLSKKEQKKIRLEVTKRLNYYRIIKTLNELTPEQEAFCKKIENNVNKLPDKEKLLITERYLQLESDYINDYQVYSQIMQISSVTYAEIRRKAMQKLSITLNIF